MTIPVTPKPDDSPVALLTGANGQLGQTFLNCLVEEGYLVYALDLRLDQVQQGVSLSMTSQIKPVQLDITSEKEVVSFFDRLNRVDLLVNNAGVGVFTPFEQRTVEELEHVMRINLLGTALMCREAVKKMKPRKSGKIVNIGSIYGQVSSDPRIYGKSGRMNSEIYSATKAGVIMMSRYLAAHYAPEGIQVNTLSPGGVFNHQTDDFVTEYCKKTPAQRMAAASDLLPAFRLMISPDSQYMTGQNITVDGGFTAW